MRQRQSVRRSLVDNKLAALDQLGRLGACQRQRRAGVLVALHDQGRAIDPGGRGAKIGKGAVIAAGALVPEGAEIPADTLAMGVPAKPKRAVTDDEKERFRINCNNYVQRTRDYLTQL